MFIWLAFLLRITEREANIGITYRDQLWALHKAHKWYINYVFPLCLFYLFLQPVIAMGSCGMIVSQTICRFHLCIDVCLFMCPCFPFLQVTCLLLPPVLLTFNFGRCWNASAFYIQISNELSIMFALFGMIISHLQGSWYLFSITFSLVLAFITNTSYALVYSR